MCCGRGTEYNKEEKFEEGRVRGEWIYIDKSEEIPRNHNTSRLRIGEIVWKTLRGFPKMTISRNQMVYKRLKGEDEGMNYNE